jgi:hypothetical protein
MTRPRLTTTQRGPDYAHRLERRDTEGADQGRRTPGAAAGSAAAITCWPARSSSRSTASGCARLCRLAPREVHLHLHGVTAEDVAAILARQDLPRPEVNRR